MAIVRSANTTGAKSNSTLGGNISLEHGANELVAYTDNNTKLSYKIDVNGVHFYNALGVEISRYGADGVHYYNASGDEIASISATGTNYYDNSGRLMTSIDADGTHYYDNSGVEITKIDENGFSYYDSSSNLRITIGADASGKMQIVLYDTGGVARTLIGQNPNGGDQIVATSVSGQDVITNLQGNALLSVPVLQQNPVQPQTEIEEPEEA